MVGRDYERYTQGRVHETASTTEGSKALRWILVQSASVAVRDVTQKSYAAYFPFRRMVKFAEGISDDELLAYCLAFGIVIGVTLGFLIGSIATNSFIGPMGAAIGIFIGLAAWIILSDQTGF